MCTHVESCRITQKHICLTLIFGKYFPHNIIDSIGRCDGIHPHTIWYHPDLALPRACLLGTHLRSMTSQTIFHRLQSLRNSGSNIPPVPCVICSYVHTDISHNHPLHMCQIQAEAPSPFDLIPALPNPGGREAGRAQDVSSQVRNHNHLHSLCIILILVP